MGRLICFTVLALLSAVSVSGASPDDGDRQPVVCRAKLESTPPVELGAAGLFRWTCSEGERKGSGYYIVFIRPVGTYVLLRVPQGRESFEFAPDAPGAWRWLVINTDPDRSRPDVESDVGHFEVKPASGEGN